MELSVIQKCYEIKKAIHLLVIKLKKEHRYGLGKHTEDSVYGILEHILGAKQASKFQKNNYLQKALAYLDLFRLNLRLILDLKLIENNTDLWKIHNDTTELGKMLGGWLRSVK